mmetsp:Transcript_18496/g.46632  ORF Transcript_18496/g.46632 Transcript_18496/m.46632 type:complete len:540 (+) Transcript_18496:473-2092(+)
MDARIDHLGDLALVVYAEAELLAEGRNVFSERGAVLDLLPPEVLADLGQVGHRQLRLPPEGLKLIHVSLTLKHLRLKGGHLAVLLLVLLFHGFLAIVEVLGDHIHPPGGPQQPLLVAADAPPPLLIPDAQRLRLCHQPRHEVLDPRLEPPHPRPDRLDRPDPLPQRVQLPPPRPGIQLLPPRVLPPPAAQAREEVCERAHLGLDAPHLPQQASRRVLEAPDALHRRLVLRPGPPRRALHALQHLGRLAIHLLDLGILLASGDAEGRDGCLDVPPPARLLLDSLVRLRQLDAKLLEVLLPPQLPIPQLGRQVLELVREGAHVAPELALHVGPHLPQHGIASRRLRLELIDAPLPVHHGHGELRVELVHLPPQREPGVVDPLLLAPHARPQPRHGRPPPVREGVEAPVDAPEGLPEARNGAESAVRRGVQRLVLRVELCAHLAEAPAHPRLEALGELGLLPVVDRLLVLDDLYELEQAQDLLAEPPGLPAEVRRRRIAGGGVEDIVVIVWVWDDDWLEVGELERCLPGLLLVLFLGSARHL